MIFKRLILKARLAVIAQGVRYHTNRTAAARRGSAWARGRGEIDIYGAHFADQAADSAVELRQLHEVQVVLRADLARLGA